MGIKGKKTQPPWQLKASSSTASRMASPAQTLIHRLGQHEEGGWSLDPRTGRAKGTCESWESTWNSLADQSIA